MNQRLFIQNLIMNAALVGLGFAWGFYNKKSNGDYVIKLYVHKEHEGKITLCGTKH